MMIIAFTCEKISSQNGSRIFRRIISLVGRSRLQQLIALALGWSGFSLLVLIYIFWVLGLQIKPRAGVLIFFLLL